MEKSLLQIHGHSDSKEKHVGNDNAKESQDKLFEATSSSNKDCRKYINRSLNMVVPNDYICDSYLKLTRRHDHPRQKQYHKQDGFNKVDPYRNE
ncbi:hypothetical protein L2E82_19148 [Cichorium intybus]|uniref:Uncharacterized protein n=1 Tax=Cichorium intybus TaxID=13427 RepID=A0ACB9FAW1_CICIN|nr:hypothetical protein L2E82_19148 [Cichorium intybus]